MINNKGNSNKAYPKVTEINPEIFSYLKQVSIDSLEKENKMDTGWWYMYGKLSRDFTNTNMTCIYP